MWQRIITRPRALGLTLIATAMVVGAAAMSDARAARPAITPTGTVTFALSPGTQPTYIFPLYPVAHGLLTNFAQFQPLMYKPLYSFGVGTKPKIDTQHSLARTPKWSNFGKSATITLNHYIWSDGEQVSAKDVEFWEYMVKANKTEWDDYVPGEYPDNVVSTKILGPRTIRFTFNKAYSQPWVELNELTQITPMPMAWDVTSVGAQPGSGGCTASAPAKCVAVYTFLAAEAAKSPTGYASDPIWSVVDGPWKLDSLTTTGEATFVPNKTYTGPDKPHIAKFIEVPFTSSAAEYSALRAGQLTVGYVPPEDTPQIGLGRSMGVYNRAVGSIRILRFRCQHA